MNKITKRIMLGLFLVLILSIVNYAHADSSSHSDPTDGVIGIPTTVDSLGLSNIWSNIRVRVGLDRDGDGDEDWSMELSMSHFQLRQLRNANCYNGRVKIRYELDTYTMEYEVLDIVVIDEVGTIL